MRLATFFNATRRGVLRGLAAAFLASTLTLGHSAMAAADLYRRHKLRALHRSPLPLALRPVAGRDQLPGCACRYGAFLCRGQPLLALLRKAHRRHLRQPSRPSIRRPPRRLTGVFRDALQACQCMLMAAISCAKSRHRLDGGYGNREAKRCAPTGYAKYGSLAKRRSTAGCSYRIPCRRKSWRANPGTASPSICSTAASTKAMRCNCCR